MHRASGLWIEREGIYAGETILLKLVAVRRLRVESGVGRLHALYTSLNAAY
jgi:hypothetical protein